MPSSIYPIILTGRDAVPGDNSTYIYRFPGGSISLRNSSIALSEITMYNSFDNIDVTLYNNNKFSIIFPDANSETTTYEITIPNGHYEIADLNSYLQSWFIANNKYFINDATNKNVYFMEIIANKNTYTVDIICYTIFTSLPQGYREPPGGFSYPYFNTEKPSLIVPSNNNFGQLIGYSSGTYQNSTSNLVPQISPISSILVRCSLCKNKMSNPDDVIYGFTFGSTPYGEIINWQPSTHEFTQIDDGFYTELKINFISNNFTRINIKDTNLLIYLILKIES